MPTYRRQWVVALMVLPALGLAAGLAFRPGHAAGQAQPHPLGMIDEKLYIGIERGMVIPYFGKLLPRGFVWADGQSRWPDEDWVHPDVKGQPVPNLNGRVLRGVKDGQKAGTTGGRDTHDHFISKHHHDLSPLTGAITNNPDPKGYKTAFKLTNEHGNHEELFFFTISPTNRYDVPLKGPLGGNQPQGQHAHDLGGVTNDAGSNYTNPDNRTPPADQADNYVPSYVAVRYIIRLR